MATIEQAPPPVAVEPEAPVASPLSNLMTRLYAIDWVTVYYVGIFIAAILTRFIGLGDRVMSHDESLHVKYSYDLYKGNGFQHTPLMHGPLLFHMTALPWSSGKPRSCATELARVRWQPTACRVLGWLGAGHHERASYRSTEKRAIAPARLR